MFLRAMYAPMRCGGHSRAYAVVVSTYVPMRWWVAPTCPVGSPRPAVSGAYAVQFQLGAYAVQCQLGAYAVRCHLRGCC